MPGTKPSILIVDDESSIRESFSLILSDDYDVTLAASGEAAVTAAAQKPFDLAFLDIRMPGINGLETLKRIKELNPDQEVVMVTAVNDVQSASEAIKVGAREYLVKPFDVAQVISLADRLIRGKRLIKEGQKVNFRKQTANLPCQSLALVEIMKTIEREAPSSVPIHIIGPAGTEKEWLARLIHQASPRPAKPLVAMDASSGAALLSKSSGESVTLLIHQKGALERAEGGTLFIDNVQELSVESQLGLLEFSGDVRLVSSTSINLNQTTFNVRLIEKLCPVTLNIPPLVERPEDIVSLLAYFADRAKLTFSKEALDVLSLYTWPGNTAELRALVSQLSASLSGKEIKVSDLPFRILARKECYTPLVFEDLWSAFEKEYVRTVLSEAKQDKVKAARVLGISTQVLESKIG